MIKKRFNEAIGIAIKGIKFEKIYEELISYNGNNNGCKDDDVSYFKDKQGKCLKGVIVDVISFKYDSFRDGGSKEELELYLMDDGKFMVLEHTGEWSCWENSTDRYNREIFKNQDIFQFNFDKIINNIIDKLNNRLSGLGERTKTQLKRLEKLKALKVS